MAVPVNDSSVSPVDDVNVSDTHTQLFFFFLPSSFFQDGLKTADKLKQYIEKLAADLYNVNTQTYAFDFSSLRCFQHQRRMVCSD